MYELYFPHDSIQIPDYSPSQTMTSTMLASDDGKYTFGKDGLCVQRLIETGVSQKSSLCGVNCWKANHYWSKRERAHRIPVNHVPLDVSTDKWRINPRLTLIQENIGKNGTRVYFECDYPVDDPNLQEVLENYVRSSE